VPDHLTVFAANYLVYLDALLALAVVGWLLRRRPPAVMTRWIITIAVLLVLSYLFAKIGEAAYYDPRPFVVDHVKPLIPHAPDNGFPSDHGLLAAAIVAAILLLSPLWAVPFAVLGAIVDWARVGAGIHHVADVVASALFVAVAMVIAVTIASIAFRWLEPRLPEKWSRETVRRSG
jgi:undecaprenyl-diphosphatase